MTSDAAAARHTTVKSLHELALDASFTPFFFQHRTTVERVLHRLEADRGMVEDVTQEAFLVARGKWDEVRTYDDPMTWTLAVARNKLRDHQRRRGRARVLFFDDVTVPEQPEPRDAHEAEERLAGWIQLLPPRQAEVVSMALEGLPDKAIAHAIGISHNTVGEYKSVALKKLRKLAESEGFQTPRRGNP